MTLGKHGHLYSVIISTFRAFFVEFGKVRSWESAVALNTAEMHTAPAHTCTGSK